MMLKASIVSVFVIALSAMRLPVDAAQTAYFQGKTRDIAGRRAGRRQTGSHRSHLGQVFDEVYSR